MSYLFIDYETFSLLDLEEVGLDNYVHHPSTGISMCAWALDCEEIELWLPHLSPPPQKLIDAWRNLAIIKIAWNATFECEFANVVMGPRYVESDFHVPISQYRDPIVLAHNLSLPGKLDSVAKILKMKELKDPRGEELKMMFCQPVSRGGEMTLFGIAPPLFRDHNSHPKEFAEYGKYCKQDVRAERDLWYRLLTVAFPERDWQGWLLDQKINTFGMPGRRDLAEKGLRLAQRYVDEQKKKLKDLTKLENPNSRDQMITWAKERGYSWNSVRANYVTAELDNPTSQITPECREAFKLRATTNKTSYKKLERFLAVLSMLDDRLRYQFKYMAAARSGRWAGGDVQVQNLPRGVKWVKKNLDHALLLLENEDYEGIKRDFTDAIDPKTKKPYNVSVVEVIITLLRSLFQAKKGKKLVVADLNAIENRGLGWAAGCKAILDVFKTCTECGFIVENLQGSFHCPRCGGTTPRCPYISFGTKLYKKEYAAMWAAYKAGNDDDRQNSKPAVLGAGYGLGGGDMYVNENGDEVRGGLWGYAKSVCGVDMSKELAHEAVKIFRESYPEVVQFWTDLEEAFKQVLKRGGVIKVGEVTWNKKEREWVKHKTCLGCVITFRRKAMEGGGYIIRMELPSGRALHYINATIEDEERTSKTPDPRTGEFHTYTSHTIYYDGIEHSATQDANGATAKKKHKWGRVKTYGGKLCENAIQAIARDILLNGMLEADKMDFHIWGLFHDELACEEDDIWDGLRLDDLIYCMTLVPDWAPGLLLGADGYEGPYYKKG